MNTLIGIKKEALTVLQRDDGISYCNLLLSLPDDVVLQTEIAVEVAIALRDAEGWARKTGIKFNLAKRKSGVWCGEVAKTLRRAEKWGKI